MDLRFYRRGDYEFVKALLQEAHLFDDVWEASENLTRKIEKDPESIIVAEDNGVVVGCVFIVEDGWNGFIWRLCVKKDYRKQGVGSLLMDRAEGIIKSRGIKEASLFVDPKNEELIDWYKKRNYKEASLWRFMYKNL